MQENPSKPSAPSFRVAVVGGGITGLAAAHRLVEQAPDIDVTLFEASERLGGALHTVRKGGFLIECGADMFSTKEPGTIDLCRRIGFEDRLIGVNERHRRAFIVHRGRLHAVPEGFSLMTPTRAWPILISPLLSPWAKLRLGSEMFVKRRSDEQDESLASFARRRLGKQAYERLVQPLVGGIYTADPERLSMNAALPQFVKMERAHGSIVKAAWKNKSASETKAGGARYNLFVTPRGGMSEFIDAIAARLPSGCVQTNTPVAGLRRAGSKWELSLGEGRAEPFDAVVIAAPAYVAARLLRQTDTSLSDDLNGIEYAGASVVALGYARKDIAHPLDGFGCVSPQVEGRQAIAVSFASVKFAGRAPDDHVLLRVFVGGALQPELGELPDDELRRLATGEVEQLLGAGASPVVSEIARWRRAMPQYHVGHLDRVARIEQQIAGHEGVELAGNAYRGVGTPFCVKSGEAAAERILACRKTPLA